MPRISIAKAGDCVPKRGHAHEPFDAARTRWANGVRFVATSTAQSVQAPRGRGSLSARPNCSRPSSFKRLSCRQGDELEGGGLCPGYNTSANAKARWNREMAVAQDSYLGSRASGCGVDGPSHALKPSTRLRAHPKDAPAQLAASTL